MYIKYIETKEQEQICAIFQLSSVVPIHGGNR